MTETVIIGAGLTGLSTAYYLETPCRILERSPGPGGLCGSVREGGFTFDHSGHFLHLRDPRVKRLVRRLLGSRLEPVRRKAAVRAFGRLIPYPFQANLFYLPPDVRDLCLRSFRDRPRAEGRDFYHWSLATFGEGITKYFMKPYNEKLWTVPATRLAADWCAPFVPRPTLKELSAGARAPQSRDFGYNVDFLYPKKGGCQTIIDAFARPARRNISFDTACARVWPRRKYLVTSGGETIHYGRLVSTQPLPELLRRCDALPAAVKAAAAKLDWNTVACVNLGFRSSGGAGDDGCHWIYFPEKKYPFYRAGMYTNVNPSMAPRGCRSMYVEIAHRPGRRLNLKQALANTLEGLRDARLIGPREEPEVVNVLNIPYAYVIYDRHRQAALKVIMDFLSEHGIFSIGRYGAWEYSFMERSILQGRETAERINENADRAG